MRKVLFEKYKIINILFCLVTGMLALGIYLFITQGYCLDVCSLDFKNGVINPVYSRSKGLFLILVVLTLFPSQIFRKWLFFVLPPMLVFIYLYVVNIPVHSSGFFSLTRSSATETGMIILAIVTTLFTLGYLVYDATSRVANKSK